MTGGFIYFLQRPAWNPGRTSSLRTRQLQLKWHCTALVLKIGATPAPTPAPAPSSSRIKLNQGWPRPWRHQTARGDRFYPFFFFTFWVNGLWMVWVSWVHFWQFSDRPASGFFFAEYLTLAMEVTRQSGIPRAAFGTCGRRLLWPTATAKLGLLGGSGVSWAWWLGASGWKQWNSSPAIEECHSEPLGRNFGSSRQQPFDAAVTGA